MNVKTGNIGKSPDWSSFKQTWPEIDVFSLLKSFIIDLVQKATKRKFLFLVETLCLFKFLFSSCCQSICRIFILIILRFREKLFNSKRCHLSSLSVWFLLFWLFFLVNWKDLQSNWRSSQLNQKYRHRFSHKTSFK